MPQLIQQGPVLTNHINRTELPSGNCSRSCCSSQQLRYSCVESMARYVAAMDAQQQAVLQSTSIVEQCSVEQCATTSSAQPSTAHSNARSGTPSKQPGAASAAGSTTSDSVFQSTPNRFAALSLDATTWRRSRVTLQLSKKPTRSAIRRHCDSY